MSNNKRSQDIRDSGITNILVTGGCGFIGTNLISHLLNSGYKITILDNLTTGKKENLPGNTTSYSPDDILVGDILDANIVNKAVENADAVVHLAAHTSVIESLQQPQESWNINVTGTLNLLEACRLKGVKVFILASSNAALGEQEPPIKETVTPKPLSPYGASKLAGEALCSVYHHTFNINTVALRFANCYGPHSEHKTSVISKFIHQILHNEPLIIYGDGNQTRDFINVNDICQAIGLCIQHNNSIGGEVFQIASGKETTINELVNMLKQITAIDISVQYKPRRIGEIERNYSDIGKAKKALAFAPMIQLRDGLHELWMLRKKVK